MEPLTDDPPIELSLRVGEEAVVPLSGAGSAGYQWSWQVEGNAEAVSIRLESEPAAPPPPGAEPRAGSRGHLLRITGRQAGRATIRLQLSRSFQPDRPPLARRIVNVEVKNS